MVFDPHGLNAKVVIHYTNHRGDVQFRTITPHGAIRFDKSEWHPEEQWLLDAFDHGKAAGRTFAMKDIHGWEPEDTADPFHKDEPKGPVIGNRTMEEWVELSRRDDCFDHMVPSDLRLILGAIKK